MAVRETHVCAADALDAWFGLALIAWNIRNLESAASIRSA
jgi:hypothetical protein